MQKKVEFRIYKNDDGISFLFSLKLKYDGPTEGFIQGMKFETGRDMMGYTVSMSQDGTVVAAGTSGINRNGATGGEYIVNNYVKIFKLNIIDGENIWGEHQTIESQYDYGFGHTLSLSGDGDTMFVGEPFLERYPSNNTSRVGNFYIYNQRIIELASIKHNIFHVNANVGIGTSEPDYPFHVYKSENTNDHEILALFQSVGDCAIKVLGKGGEAYVEIANTNTSTGSTIDSWGIGTNDDKKLHLAYGQNGTMNKTDKMVITDLGRVGIGTDNPGSTLHIKAKSDSNKVGNGLKSDSSYALTMERYGTTDTWSLMINSSGSTNHNELNFLYNGYRRCYLLDTGKNESLNFTGQHRNIVNNIEENCIGLIVISNGKYINLDNNMKPSINESLPICELSNKEKDKRVFGVISDKEDNEDNNRVYTNGVWASVFDKVNVNEKRYFINSLGEGAMWVCNTNGDLENGDYITTSNVLGYGQKQHDDLLHNFTVAKITCDCNFSLMKQNQKQIKTIQKERIVDDILKDESGNTILDTSGNETIIQKTITEQELVFDNSGNVIIEDKQDLSGNSIEDYPYDIRFLLPDGTIISEEEYLTLKSNNKVCYIAYFVGVTYHCG